METGLNWPVTVVVDHIIPLKAGAAMETGLNWPVTERAKLLGVGFEMAPQWRPALIGRLRGRELHKSTAMYG